VVFAASQGDPGFLDSLSAASGGMAFGPLASAALPTLNPAGGGAVASGVHIAQVVEDPSPPLKRYDPGHPDAGPDGYVAYPDINPLTEMVDLMGATRAYGLNSSAVQAEKGMISAALEIAKA
jgi:flagellar basal-body rod protein FlgC